MKSCNFCIHENKVFDLDGYEILPDEDDIVCVFLNGMERRFKIDKMIVWLKDSGYNNLFKKPKILPKPKKEKKKIIKRVSKIKKNHGFKKRKIYCSNGQAYESLYQASQKIGIDRSSICQVLNNKNNRKTVVGLTFKYADNEHIIN